MAQKKIHILWADSRTVDILLEENPVADFYYSCVRHLRHINLQFNARQNPLYAQQVPREDRISELVEESRLVGLDIDVDKLGSQPYLNYLHAVYFDAARKPNFDPRWLTVHNNIHLLEEHDGNSRVFPSLWFDFESAAGPLIKKFNREYLKYSTTQTRAGMCSIRERELGKNPDLYRRHKEPEDIRVLCEQSKPWIDLKPVMNITIEDYNGLHNFNEDEFNQWFAPYREQWCKHWGITDWTPTEMYAAIPIGYVENLTQLTDCFAKLDYPIRLTI
jgi:hypothetical protein